jgi:protein Mpv17
MPAQLLTLLVRRFKRLGTMFTFSSFPLSIATRVFFNQFTFAPFINTYFFSMQALLTGGDVWERVREKVPITWLNSWKLWPGIIAFNLAFVPHHFRGIVAGFASVGWQTYLSIQNKKAEMLEEAKLTQAQAPALVANTGVLAQAA